MCVCVCVRACVSDNLFLFVNGGPRCTHHSEARRARSENLPLIFSSTTCFTLSRGKSVTVFIHAVRARRQSRDHMSLVLLLAASEGHVRLNYIDGSDLPIHGAPTRPGTQSRPLRSLIGACVPPVTALSRVRVFPLSEPTGQRRSTPATAAPTTSTPQLANPNGSYLSRKSGVSRRGGGWRLERTCVVCLVRGLLRERRVSAQVRPLNNTPAQSKFGVR